MKRRDEEKKGMHTKERCRRGGIQEVRLGQDARCKKDLMKEMRDAKFVVFFSPEIVGSRMKSAHYFILFLTVQASLYAKKDSRICFQAYEYIHMCIISKNEANSRTYKKVYDTQAVTPKQTFLAIFFFTHEYNVPPQKLLNIFIILFLINIDQYIITNKKIIHNFYFLTVLNLFIFSHTFGKSAS